MNDVQVTLVGTITSEPRYVSGGDDVPVVKFRIRAQPRRYLKATNSWQDGEPSYYTAIAFRHLAEHVASSLGVGDPVLAHGRLRIARWRAGQDPIVTAEVELVSVGHDLRWGTTVYRKAQPPPLMRRSERRVPVGEGGENGELAAAEVGAEAGVGTGAGAAFEIGTGSGIGVAADVGAQPTADVPSEPLPSDLPQAA